MRNQLRLWAPLRRHRKHDVLELVRTAKFLGVVKNDSCNCNVCWQYKEAERLKRQNNTGERTITPSKVYTLRNESVINNIFSIKASRCHLNKHYQEEDNVDRDENSDFEDMDGRGIPPRQYIWRESRGKHAVRTLGDRNSNARGYEEYSNLLVVVMGVNNRMCRMLLDSGSEVDVLSKQWVEKFKQRLDLKKTDAVIQLAEEEVIAKVTEEVINVRLDLFPQASSRQYSTRTNMLVMNTGHDRFDGIIGIGTMAKLGIHVTIPKFSDAAKAAAKEDAENLNRGYLVVNNEDRKEDDKNLKMKLANLISQNQVVKKSQWTTMKNGIIDFELTEEQLRQAYRTNTNYVSLAFFQAVDEQVENWLKDDIIEINNENTPLNLPLIAIKQTNTDGSLRKIRVCVDFRQLNKLLSMDSYTIPKFNELHSMLVGCNYFSVIDLESGYNQVMVSERCRKYMAFRWKGTQYRFKGTPFGINFLPSQFNRMVSHHLRGIPGVIVYIDDIFIASKTMIEHEVAVMDVLVKLTEARMRINITKCMFGRSEVDYLGFKMSTKGVQVDPNRIKRLNEMKVPTTGRELLSFLCMANYIRHHIPEFGIVAGPLYEIASRMGKKKLSTDDKWLAEGLIAWEKLNRIIQSPLVLQYPDSNLTFILRTDACVTGYGGYLFQEGPDGQERIIHIFSGTFKRAQMAYSIPKKELYAIIYAFRNLEFYLRGAKFKLQIDAMCLTELHYKQIDCETMAKWALVLSTFDYDIEHIPGSSNIFADFLSRQNEDCTMAEWIRLKASYYEDMKVKAETECNVKLVKLTRKTSEKNVSDIDPQYTAVIQKKLRLLAIRKQTQHSYNAGGKLPFNADTFTNDWKLNQKYFVEAEKRWGPHTIDLFAASHNAQLERYLTAEINAFSIKWGNENAWANPPWHLIPRVLQRVKVEKIDLTICVPYYNRAAWWPVFTKMQKDKPIMIGKQQDVFLRRGVEQVGATPWDVTIISRITGKQDCVRDTNFDELVAIEIKNCSLLSQVKQLTTAAMTLCSQIELAGEVGSFMASNNATGEEIKPIFYPTPEDKKCEGQFGGLNAIQTRSRTKSNNNQEEQEETLENRARDDDYVFHHTEHSNAQYRPVATEQGAKNTELSWAQRYDIVCKYHCLSHAKVETVANLVRSTGGYNWKDTLELAEQADYDCSTCELKRIEKKGYHPLRSLKSRHAGDVWVIDLIQLPRKYDSNDQNAFILHVLDHWSSYSWLRALPNKKAKTIAHFLINIMMDNGCPKEFRHDGGGEFGKETKIAIEIIAASHRVVGIPYHAQSQGSNERKHGELKDILIELMEKDLGNNRDWKQVLPFAQMKLNLQVNRKHGSTPFAVYFGRTHNVFNVKENYGTPLEWIDVIKKYDTLIIPAINDKIDTYHEAEEMNFLKAHETEIRDYEIHEVVKVRVAGEAGQGPKDALTYDWHGPFRILGKVKGGYNIGYVHPRKGQENVPLNIHVIPPEQIAPWRRSFKVERHKEEWIVSKLIDHREVGKNKERFYLVVWEGNWEPTWEPAENISTTLKNSYWAKKHKGKKQPLEEEGITADDFLDAEMAKRKFNRLQSQESIVYRDLVSVGISERDTKHFKHKKNTRTKYFS